MAAAGAFDVSYHRYGSRVRGSGTHEKSFFDGVDVSLEGIATLAPADEQWLVARQLKVIDGHVAQAVKAFSMDAPEKMCAGVADGLKAQTNALIAKVEASRLTGQEKYECAA